MKRIHLLLLVILTASFTFGCGKPEPDPKGSFERFYPQYLAELQKIYVQVAEGAKRSGLETDGKPNEILVEKTSYDVRKTDSLIQPYEASIEFVERLSLREVVYSLRFGYQNGKWVLTSGSVLGQNFHLTSEDHDGEKDLWDAYIRVKQ